MADPTVIDIKAGTMIKFFLIIIGFLLLYLLKDVVVILLFAIVIASAISPFATWLDEKKIPGMLGVLLLYLVLFSLLVILLSLVIPTMAYELNQLAQSLPRFFSSLSTALESAQTNSRYFTVLTDVQNILDSSSHFLQISSAS